MKTHATEVTRVEVVQSIICDVCGSSIKDDVISIDAGVDINWCVYSALDRDGGEGISYKADICKSCVPAIIGILKNNGVKIQETEFTF